MHEPLIELTDLAADQWGMFTTAQAERVGVERARLAYGARTGRFERLAHGVYAVAGTQEDHLTHLRAAFLGSHPSLLLRERQEQSPLTGVVSHGSAASVHGFGNLRALAHEFTFPQRKTSRRPDVVLHRADLSEMDVTINDGLPVTTVERTAADLLAEGTDDDHVSDFLKDAYRARRVNRERLMRAIGRVAATQGRDPRLMVADLLPTPSHLDLGIPKDALESLTGAATAAMQATMAPALAEITAQLAPLRELLTTFVSKGAPRAEAAEFARRISETMPPAQMALLVDELKRQIQSTSKHVAASTEETRDDV